MADLGSTLGEPDEPDEPDPKWVQLVEHEAERALTGQQARSTTLLIVATLVATVAGGISAAGAAVAGQPANLLSPDQGWSWQRTLTAGLGAASLVFGVLVFLSHELYDVDPVGRTERAVADRLDAAAFQTRLVDAKLQAYEITEGGLRRARLFLYAQIAVGFLAVVFGGWLLAR
jgi:hypothetical protein